MPVLVLSRDNSRAATDSRMADVETVWNQMQEDLKKLSTRSRRIIARGSGHFIQLNRPDLIEKEVPLFIERIRGTVPQPQDYGSTTIE
jgi:pimeloyl-ACP methyl ester carboxylesterase